MGWNHLTQDRVCVSCEYSKRPLDSMKDRTFLDQPVDIHFSRRILLCGMNWYHISSNCTINRSTSTDEC
jgi:hypothetical protein